MRTTVGPLPAAVYWRRRFLVLAAVLIVVLGLFMACSGPDKADPRSTGAGGQVPASGTVSEGVLTPDVEPSFEDAGPPHQPVLPDPTDVPAGDESGVSAAPSASAAQQTGPCTDAEIGVTPVPGRTAAKRGQPIDLRLRIRNVSNRTCARDVGAELQEIYIKQGAHKVWSSDACGLSKGSDVQQFAPNAERVYRVTWNGRTSTRCSGGAAAGPYPAAGQYQVLGRLGAKVSDPIQLSLTA